MKCPIFSASLYEDERREVTAGTFISIRCSKPGCGYFDNKTLPVNIYDTIIDNYAR